MPLFFEDVDDVLAALVKALGGPKKVGCDMRPTLTPDAAKKWITDCLNPDRRERFSPDQVFWLFREARRLGFHAAMEWLCDDLGYARTQAVDPVDERSALLAREEHVLAELRELISRRERLTQR